MRRFILGALFASLLVAPTAYAVGKNLHVTGDLTVDGSAAVAGNTSVGGDVFARSIQAQGPTISNLSLAYAVQLTTTRLSVADGGFGFEWLDQNATATRIIAGQFADPALIPVPTSTLLLRRMGDGTAELWFKVGPLATDWLRIAP